MSFENPLIDKKKRKKKGKMLAFKRLNEFTIYIKLIK